jgi:CMP-N-acetylneuraminic acid synthetase
MKSNYEVVALLPMKARSERIPNKNFRNFLGKPLFRWILDTLLSVQKISKIIINTDARAIFKEHGITSSERIIIRDRRTDLCGDFVSMNKIIEDDVSRFSAEIYIMTHTTNPILRPDTIKKALHEFQKNCIDGEFDSLFTVNRYQTRFYRGDGSPVNHDPENLIRTQDLESWYEENSNLYIFSKKSFMEKHARIGKKPFLFEMPRWESIDIDDQDSWDLAEMVARSKV